MIVLSKQLPVNVITEVTNPKFVLNPNGKVLTLTGRDVSDNAPIRVNFFVSSDIGVEILVNQVATQIPMYGEVEDLAAATRLWNTYTGNLYVYPTRTISVDANGSPRVYTNYSLDINNMPTTVEFSDDADV